MLYTTAKVNACQWSPKSAESSHKLRTSPKPRILCMQSHMFSLSLCSNLWGSEQRHKFVSWKVPQNRYLPTLLQMNENSFSYSLYITVVCERSLHSYSDMLQGSNLPAAVSKWETAAGCVNILLVIPEKHAASQERACPQGEKISGTDLTSQGLPDSVFQVEQGEQNPREQWIWN